LSVIRIVCKIKGVIARSEEDSFASLGTGSAISKKPVIDYMKALQHQTLYNVGENKKKEVLQHEKVLWM